MTCKKLTQRILSLFYPDKNPRFFFHVSTFTLFDHLSVPLIYVNLLARRIYNARFKIVLEYSWMLNSIMLREFARICVLSIRLNTFRLTFVKRKRCAQIDLSSIHTWSAYRARVCNLHTRTHSVHRSQPEARMIVYMQHLLVSSTEYYSSELFYKISRSKLKRYFLSNLFIFLTFTIWAKNIFHRIFSNKSNTAYLVKNIILFYLKLYLTIIKILLI